MVARNLSDYLTIPLLYFCRAWQSARTARAVVTLDERDQVGVQRAGCADAVDDNVRHLIAMIVRVEPPIDPNRRAAINLDPARYDDPFPIGLAPQHVEGCAVEGAEGGRIADDDGPQTPRPMMRIAPKPRRPTVGPPPSISDIGNSAGGFWAGMSPS
jgi:hypothetical protein